MATSLSPLYLPAGQWVDIYATLNARSGVNIPVGTRIRVHNPFQTNVYLTEASSTPAAIDSEPSDRTVGVTIIRQSQDRENAASNVGAWAFAFKDTSVQVEEV